MEVRLDQKDKQILYLLDVDARQHNSEIARKVKLSKDAVGYRIKNMEKAGLIRGYTTIIDSAKLGYIWYRAYLNLMDTTPKILDEFVEILKKEPNVCWIAKVDGQWNFIFTIWVKSNKEFREFYNNKLMLGFKRYIKDRLICPVTSYFHLGRSYILEKEKAQKTEIVGGGEKEHHDNIDLEILKIISNNARAQLISIAKEVKLDSMTIHNRIRKMEEKGIIQGYKVDLDFNLLKREFYSVKINLNDMSNIKKLENYTKTIPELTNITEAVGSFDFEFDLEVENSEQYHKIISELQIRFEFIREISYFRVLKNYKITYMPEI